MWRAFFMAVGLSLCVFGVECMVVDRFVLADTVTRTTPFMITEDIPTLDGDQLTTQRRILVPPEWAPWGLLSGGIMTVLYAATFAHRSGE